MFAPFKEAAEYLFTVPMWNASVPWVLKHLIDAITQPGTVFGFDPANGYIPLLEGKRAIVVYTSGVYSPGATIQFGADFHAEEAYEAILPERFRLTILAVAIDGRPVLGGTVGTLGVIVSPVVVHVVVVVEDMRHAERERFQDAVRAVQPRIAKEGVMDKVVSNAIDIGVDHKRINETHDQHHPQRGERKKEVHRQKIGKVK